MVLDQIEAELEKRKLEYQGGCWAVFKVLLWGWPMALHTVTAHTEPHGACAHSSRGVAADHLGLSHLGHTTVIALLTSSIPPGSPHTLQDPCPPGCFAGALQSPQRADTSHVPLQPTNWLLTPWSRSVPIALWGRSIRLHATTDVCHLQVLSACPPPRAPSSHTGPWHTAGSLVALRGPSEAAAVRVVRQSAAGGPERPRPALTSNKHRRAPAESRPTALAAQARPRIACPTVTSASLWSRAPNPGTAGDARDGAQPSGVNEGQPHSWPYVGSRASWGPRAQRRLQCALRPQCGTTQRPNCIQQTPSLTDLRAGGIRQGSASLGALWCPDTPAELLQPPGSTQAPQPRAVPPTSRSCTCQPQGHAAPSRLQPQHPCNYLAAENIS